MRGRDGRTAPASGDDAIELLIDLVATPSPSGAERAASRLLAEWMSAHGLTSEIDEVGNAVGTKGSGPREVLLLGHIDTFPGEVPVRREGNLLYGRGTVDAKGPLCAFAAAASAVEVPEGWRATVVGAVEEESATSLGARHVMRARSKRIGTAPAYCVIGEPSRWDRVTIGYRGRLLFDVTLRASLSHSAGPELSPAERGVALWQAVQAFAESRNSRTAASGTFETLSPSLRSITTRSDGAYGVVELSIGFRLPPSQTLHDLERHVMKALSGSLGGSGDWIDSSETSAVGAPSRTYRLASPLGADAGSELSCRVHGGEQAFRAGKSNPLVRSFLAAIRAEGGAPRFVVKSGTSDMNVVGPEWSETPILAYGPGDSALDHTPGEHVDLDEFSRAIGVLRRALRALMR